MQKKQATCFVSMHSDENAAVRKSPSLETADSKAHTLSLTLAPVFYGASPLICCSDFPESMAAHYVVIEMQAIESESERVNKDPFASTIVRRFGSFEASVVYIRRTQRHSSLVFVATAAKRGRIASARSERKKEGAGDIALRPGSRK